MDDNLQVTPEQKPKFSLKNFLKTLPAKIKVFWKTPPKGRYLNLKEILCFGGSAFGMSTLVTVVSGLITATQIPTIYNFNVIHGAWIYLIASVLGLIIQPFFSKLLQNTNTKFGRYKPFILVMAPILAVFAILATWQPQYALEKQRIIYAYCTCIPTLIMWNLFQNTYYLLPGVITPNQQERTDIWAPIGLVIGFSPTIMGVVGNLLKAYFTNKGMEYMAYRYLGFIYAAVGLALILCLFLVKERIINTNSNQEKVGLFEGMRMVVKNKPLMVLTLALILGCCRTVVEVDAEYIGRLRYASDIPTGQTIFATLTMVTGFAVTPNMILLPLFTRKFNNRTIMMFWAACNVVGYLVLGCVGIANIPQGIWSILIITTLRFISLFNALTSLQPLMLAQLSDYQQLKTGKRLEGFIQSFLYVLVLVFTNVGILVMAYIKDAMGYQSANFVGRDGAIPTPTREQIDNALNYFDIAFIVSAVSAALMLITMLFYKLGKKEHAKIVAALEAKSRQEGQYTLDEEIGKESISDIGLEEATAIMNAPSSESLVRESFEESDTETTSEDTLTTENTIEDEGSEITEDSPDEDEKE